MLATSAAEIAVERYGIPSSTMKAQTEPIAQATNASGRQSASICAFGRIRYWSTRMTAPMGGTRTPSSDSHWMKKAHTIAASADNPDDTKDHCHHAHVVAENARPAGRRIIEAVRADRTEVDV